jgi:hypothetical protein
MALKHKASVRGRVSGKRAAKTGGTSVYARKSARAVLLRRRRSAAMVVDQFMRGHITTGRPSVNALALQRPPR